MKRDELDKSKDNDAPSLQSMLEVKLEALLHDLIRQHGTVETAKKLGVNYKTVARSVESGKLSVHLRQALTGLLLARGNFQTAPREESEDVAVAVERLAAEMRNALGDLRQEVKAGFDSLTKRQARELEKLSQRLPTTEGHPPTGGKVHLSATDRTWPRGSQPRRESGNTDPSVVTVETEAGDDAVDGTAWPLVQEWRELRRSHPFEGSGMDWLEKEIELRKLEIVLIEEHGLTLPPDTFPWDSLGRKTQVRWRRRTLRRLKKELFRARLRWWLRRALTFNLWRGK